MVFKIKRLLPERVLWRAKYSMSLMCLAFSCAILCSYIGQAVEEDGCTIDGIKYKTCEIETFGD